MSLKIFDTLHSGERRKQRRISLERVSLAVNNPDHEYDGYNEGTRVFESKEPPPPIKVVTSWPPDNDEVYLVTVYPYKPRERSD